jgi:MipA family protein
MRSSAAVVALLAASAASAQETRPPLWELGGFAVGATQQAYPGSDEDVSRAIALPFFLYRGKVLRADQDTAGLRALKTERLELDVGFGGSLGARADKIDARAGMPRLGTLVEVGPRLQVRLGEATGGKWKFELPLRAVFDVNDGWRQRGTAFEPALVFERRAAVGPFSGWSYSTRATAVWGDGKLADTFYGVAPAFATATRPAYQAKSGLIALRLGSSVSVPLGKDWRLFGFARWQTVAGAANDASPLVRRESGWSGGIGVSWTWMRSDQRAND